MYEQIDFLGIKFNDYCNLNCKYCFETNNSRSRHNVFNKGKELVEFLKTLNIGPKLYINLLGGEITIYPNELYNLCKELKKIERYKDTTVKIGIVSNGTNHNFIMNDLIKIISPESVKISWDGIHASEIAQTHLTDKQLSTIVDKVGCSKYNNEVMIAIAVTKDNICYLADSIQYALEQGCKKLSYYFIFNDEYSKYYNTEEFKTIFIHQLHKIYMLYNQYDFDLDNLTYMIYNKFINPDFIYDHKCRYIGKMFMVVPNGDIYPCLLLKEIDGLLDNNNDLILGNISTGFDSKSMSNFTNLYTNLLNENIDRCIQCNHVSYCTECPLETRYIFNSYNKCISRKVIYDIEKECFDKYISREYLDKDTREFNLDYYSKRFLSGNQNLAL